MAFGQRTPATTLLLAAILAGFALEFLTGGVTGTLSQAGANYAPAVSQGQYWRLVTSMFLHGGLLHLALNGWALYQLGGLFEIWLGSVRLLAVFLLSGIAGSIASVLWTVGPSVGASGAIFGLLGALIAFLLRRHQALTPGAKSLLMQLVMWAAINVFFGFNTPGIDNAAHLGGFAAGLLVGLVLRERRRYQPVAEV
jgi:rhomboid protease GluP